MENPQPLVTMPLKIYEDMQAEIALLKKQVQEKTIIQYEPHPVYGYLVLGLMSLVIVWLLSGAPTPWTP